MSKVNLVLPLYMYLIYLLGVYRIVEVSGVLGNTDYGLVFEIVPGVLFIILKEHKLEKLGYLLQKYF
jgi:hypothetical protein